ncbi:histidine phosphatase family protein [Streptomyces sp. NPDC059708]|uniref:histidine phosphatase family protein n=1 Tax=Streptomyces sp. NPDC059708 TaxID=3346916 RepID=UPI0036B5B795
MVHDYEGRSSALSRRSVIGGLGTVPLLVAGCASKSKSATPPPSAPIPSPGATTGGDGSGSGDLVVMIIRHGEKPTGSEKGRDDNGKPDSHSLTDRGWARANALPRLFAPKPAAGLERPVKVYAATDQGPDAGGHRMRQTVTPLARQLGLSIDLTYAESKETDLAAAVSAAAGPVLICWEHSRIPTIAKALAPRSGAPTSWPDRFDLVWVLNRTAGTWSFKEVGQRLLDTDA